MFEQHQILHKKRQQFHCSIRREKKNDYFRQQRAILMQRLICLQQQQMNKLLDSYQQKQQWIHLRSLQLTGIPNKEWKSYINDLQKGFMCFGSNFTLWIEYGIINKLCTVFHDDNLSLNLGYYAARLLSSLIYYENQTQSQKTSYIAEEILSQQVLENICSIAQNSHDNEKCGYMTLLANLSMTDSKKINKAGAMNLFIRWTSKVISQKSIKKQELDIIYEFYYSVIYKEVMDYTVYTSILQVLGSMSVLNQTDELKRQILVIIVEIIKKKTTQAIYTQVFNNPRLLKFIFQLSLNKHQKVRIIAWQILGYLSSSQKNIGYIFQQYCFFNRALTAYSFEVNNSNNFDRITIYILGCIANLVGQNQIYRQIIIKDKLIDIAIDSIHPQRSKKLKQDGYYCLCRIVNGGNYQLYNRIITDYPILFDRLILGLESMSALTVYDIASTLLYFIQTQNKVYRQEGNIIFAILDSKYDFQKIFDQTQIKFNKNSKVSYVLNQIRQLQSIYI